MADASGSGDPIGDILRRLLERGTNMTKKFNYQNLIVKKFGGVQLFLQGSWNYERMQNLGWAYALIPAIKKLYTSKKKIELLL